MKGRQKRSKGRALANRGYMREAHEDLQESKQLIKDLLKMRRDLFLGKRKDSGQLDEYREKAINAINNLFSDEVDEDEK